MGGEKYAGGPGVVGADTEESVDFAPLVAKARPRELDARGRFAAHAEGFAALMVSYKRDARTCNHASGEGARQAGNGASDSRV